MGTIATQITSLTIVYSTVYSDADQRKHQSSASLAFVRGIHRGSLNSPHKWPVTRKMFLFGDVSWGVAIVIHNVCECHASSKPEIYESEFDTGTIHRWAVLWNHDDVIKWKHFLRYWPFVRKIHLLPVNSAHRGQWCGALMVFFDLRLSKRLSWHSWHRCMIWYAIALIMTSL